MPNQTHWPILLISLAFALVFSFFAALQLEESDAILWLPIFGFPVVAAAMACFRFYKLPFLVGAFVLYLGLALYFIPRFIEEWTASQEDEMPLTSQPYPQKLERTIGLTICLLASIYHIWGYYQITDDKRQ